MQQELIEMLEEIISYVEVWHKEDQDVIDRAEALVEKAKNNAPAVQVYQLAKLGGPTETAWIDVTQEVYEDAGFYKDDFKRRILSATPAPVPAVPQEEGRPGIPLRKAYKHLLIVAPAQEQCNACCGTGRMVRDPDIGTDQECFVCDGTGFLPAQEPVTLTPAEIDRAVLEATGFDGFGTQPMNTHDTRNIGLEVIAALRAKEKK